MHRPSRQLSIAALAAAALLIAACSQDPYVVNTKGGLGDVGLPRDAGPDGDDRLGDGASGDGLDGGDADACVPTNGGKETCDSLDNDCNGKVDDVDPALLLTDIDNCGTCGHACVYINAFSTCEAGTCALDKCAPGYYDIDPAKPGCEYQCLVSNGGVEVCDGADNDCDGKIDETFDLMTDKENCGKCGNRCVFSNATGECQMGTCVITGCAAGFQNNNKNDADGCEYKCPVWPVTAEQCSGKDDDCDGLIDEGTPGSGVYCDTKRLGECRDGKTQCHGGKLECVQDKTASTEICDGKDNDCDGDTDEGFDLNTNVKHCGTCNNACAFPNAIPKCVNTICQIDRCLNGFADLDPTKPGCEHTCEVFPTVLEVCNGKDDDCDGTKDEGFDLNTDPKNCGTCGKVCSFPNATATCVAGVCAQGPCNPDYYDNDPTQPGCEYYCLRSNNGVETCDKADNDCDGQIDEGFDKQTDVNNCGVCGKVCQFNNAAASCAAGTCVMGACDAGFKDLDPTVPGCEYHCPVWPPTTNETSAATRCDGVDNDCDGQVDENFPTNTACGSSIGQCSSGTLTCQNGVESCVGGQEPQAEICDGKDNDCDGLSDEGFDKLNDPRYCENCAGCSIPHAIAGCVNGHCQIAVCEQGWVDNDPTIPGCEYKCTPTGPEICDGIDNDCDGQVDEAADLTVPSNACVSVGPCAGTTATCQGIYGWVCGYPSPVEKRTCTQDSDCILVPCNTTLGICPGELPDDESLCDNNDNDCDGLSDEPFTNKGSACAQSGQQGICQGTGTFVCATNQLSTVCSITNVGQPPTNELCNGLDDDCDGKVDEAEDDAAGLGVKDATLRITRGGEDFYIYRYEASRPGATATSAGALTHRACSSPSVLPWTNVTRSAAEAACRAIQPACGGAGQPPCWRLCSANEWLEACQGVAATVYPYADVHQPNTCNGKENDGDGAQAGNQDVLLPTGAKSGCTAGTEGVFDMSGNAREWTSELRGAAPGPTGYTVRGGAYDTSAYGQRCDFTFAIFPESFAYPNLGFRCCRDAS